MAPGVVPPRPGVMEANAPDSSSARGFFSSDSIRLGLPYTRDLGVRMDVDLRRSATLRSTWSLNASMFDASGMSDLLSFLLACSTEKPSQWSARSVASRLNWRHSAKASSAMTLESRA